MRNVDLDKGAQLQADNLLLAPIYKVAGKGFSEIDKKSITSMGARRSLNPSMISEDIAQSLHTHGQAFEENLKDIDHLMQKDFIQEEVNFPLPIDNYQADSNNLTDKMLAQSKIPLPESESLATDRPLRLEADKLTQVAPFAKRFKFVIAAIVFKLLKMFIYLGICVYAIENIKSQGDELRILSLYFAEVNYFNHQLGKFYAMNPESNMPVTQSYSREILEFRADRLVETRQELTTSQVGKQLLLLDHPWPPFRQQFFSNGSTYSKDVSNAMKLFIDSEYRSILFTSLISSNNLLSEVYTKMNKWPNPDYMENFMSILKAQDEIISLQRDKRDFYLKLLDTTFLSFLLIYLFSVGVISYFLVLLMILKDELLYETIYIFFKFPNSLISSRLFLLRIQAAIAKLELSQKSTYSAELKRSDHLPR